MLGIAARTIYRKLAAEEGKDEPKPAEVVEVKPV
jgi:hypothetical protein